MTMRPVQSRSISHVGFDPATKTLAMQFHHSGHIYHFAGVDPKAHQALLSAPSIGKHFGAHIKPRYAAKRIK